MKRNKKTPLLNRLPSGLVIPTGKCEHCRWTILFENANCRLELTDRGRQWVLYNGYSQRKAKDEYKAWLEQEEDKESGF